MHIFLKNESNKTIIVRLDETEYTLIPSLGRCIETEKEILNLTVCADEKYRCDPITGKLGFSYFHRFVVASSYTVAIRNNSEICFYSETAYGNNFESYSRIFPFSPDCEISAPYYTVKNENEIKEKIFRSDKTETALLQGALVVGKLLKAKNTYDDIVVGGIIGVIALIIFVLIWIFVDFKTASYIYCSIAVIGFLVWKIFIERAIKKIKHKAKKKTEEKFEKLFLPCENMPEGAFKGKDSYFDHDYINAVFVHSNKKTYK